VTLLEFITARLDEDEAAARAIDVPDWRAESSWMSELIEPLPSQKRLYDGQFPLITAEDVAHIARHDPARVLREVEARRRTLARHQPVEQWSGWDHIPAGQPGARKLYGLDCSTCIVDHPPGSAAYECQHGSVSWPCPEVLDLASVWSDHPDYREEWAA